MDFDYFYRNKDQIKVWELHVSNLPNWVFLFYYHRLMIGSWLSFSVNGAKSDQPLSSRFTIRRPCQASWDSGTSIKWLMLLKSNFYIIQGLIEAPWKAKEFVWIFRSRLYFVAISATSSAIWWINASICNQSND
jgi:hypothetical protein